VSPRAREAAAAGAAALVAFLPFLRGVARGASFYFRDLSVQFFPVRRFVVEGLRAGQLRFWNPYAYEGVPLSPLPINYPLDLLQLLRADEAFFSLLLALHLPLAAVCAYLLAREIGAGRLGAAAGGLTFALGGFALSTVNLYVYCEALPWVALFVLALLRAAAGGRRQVAWAAISGALLFSTTAVEFAAQAILIGVVLAPSPLSRRAAARLAASLVLATGLAAVVLGPTSALVAGSAREDGFPTAVVLAHSVHPVALLQVVVGGLFGDTSRLAERFWGMNFFPRGFPYILSLYLGATALGLAVAGVAMRRRPAYRLLLLLVLALAVCIGRWAGLEPVVEALGWLRKLRFPVKAFLSVHLAAALLVSLGVTAVSAGDRRALRALAWSGLAIGSSLAAAPTVISRLPRLGQTLLQHFFPPDLPWSLRLAYAGSIGLDATSGGVLALLSGGLAVLALRGRLRPVLVAVAATLLLAADLLRAGAGLNPMVAADFLKASPEATAMAERLRAEGGRVLPMDLSYSPAYAQARVSRQGHDELWSFALVEDTLAPDTNLRLGVPTALTPDRTMLVPSDRVLGPESASPTALAALMPRLREAAVSHVLSPDALSVPGLTLEQTVAPPRIAPLSVGVYRVAGSRPLVEIPPDVAAGNVRSVERRGDRLQIEVEMGGSGRLLVREALTRGWQARVDGRPAAIEREAAAHVALVLGPGLHRVVLRYHPPGLLAGAVVTAVSLGATLLLFLSGQPRRPAGRLP
jgi:uncharacterized membrane protein YqgA involved in biofilm formation